MKKTSFELTYKERFPFQTLAEPAEVRIPLLGHSVLLKKKTEIAKGGLLGTHPDPLRGNVHSSVAGIITDITDKHVQITKADVSVPPVEPVDLSAFSGAELHLHAKQLGLGRRDINPKTKILVINGLNTEPGITWAETMLEDHVETLQAGLELIKRMYSFKQVTLVLPEQGSSQLHGVSVVYTKAKYPYSLPQLVVKAATGKELPANVSVLNLHVLWRFGRVAQTGLPAIETVLTVQNTNYRMLAGTPIQHILDLTGITPEFGDSIILGGVMRGEAVAELSRCVASYSYGLFHIASKDFSHVEENPCINCGACVRYCPARLTPSTISRYSEFMRFEMCRKHDVLFCMDCGLCNFYCVARRPMLQYMRIAKKQIAMADQAHNAANT